MKVKKDTSILDLILKHYYAGSSIIDLGKRRKALKCIKQFAKGLYSQVKI